MFCWGELLTVLNLNWRDFMKSLIFLSVAVLCFSGLVFGEEKAQKAKPDEENSCSEEDTC